MIGHIMKMLCELQTMISTFIRSSMRHKELWKWERSSFVPVFLQFIAVSLRPAGESVHVRNVQLQREEGRASGADAAGGLHGGLLRPPAR